MLLALDMGNTNITIGVYEKDSLRFESRLATDCAKMEDQYAVEIMDILRLYGIEPREIEGAIISSVVPPRHCRSGGKDHGCGAHDGGAGDKNRHRYPYRQSRPAGCRSAGRGCRGGGPLWGAVHYLGSGDRHDGIRGE